MPRNRTDRRPHRAHCTDDIEELDDSDLSGFEVGTLFDDDPFSHKSWMITAIDDHEHTQAQQIEPFDLLDLRVGDAEKPTPIDTAYAQLWGVESIEGRHHISPIGIVYPSDKGPVLTSSMAIVAQLPWLAAAQVATTPATPACPTRAPISGNSDYSTTSYRSRRAARSAGDALVWSRAKTDAGLVRNGFTCLNAQCKRKVVTGLKVWRSRTTHVSLFGSIGWAEWRYYAEGRYSWTATILCF